MTLVEIAEARIERARAELRSARAFRRSVNVPTFNQEAKAVLDFVAERFGVQACDLVGPARASRISTPRFVAMYLLRSIHGLSLEQIGPFFNRDRTTVDQALRTVHDRRDTEKKFRAELSEIVRAYTPPELFPLQDVSVDSPRIQWKKRHGIISLRHARAKCAATWFAGFQAWWPGLYGVQFFANETATNGDHRIGEGRTEDEALIDLLSSSDARKINVQHWNVENLQTEKTTNACI